MPSDCRGEDNVEIQRHVLVLLLAINATMFCLEVVAGILANSTALLADSLDMLADAAIYGIALYTVGKPNSAKRRAAFTSGIFQGVPGLLVVSEVVRHFLGSRKLPYFPVDQSSGETLKATGYRASRLRLGRSAPYERPW
jgi:Co/Zn/Cd efflux system component